MSDLQIPQFTLGDRLAKARETAGITVQGMAERLGVSRTTVSNYEHQRTEPTRAILRAYEAETGVPLWWLLDQDSPEDGGDKHLTARSTKWDSTPLRMIPYQPALPLAA